jgi:hypothetical protein
MKIMPKTVRGWVMILVHGLETWVLAVPVFYLFCGLLGYPIKIHGGLLIAHVASTTILLILSIGIMFKLRSAGITALMVSLIGILADGVILLPFAMSRQ